MSRALCCVHLHLPLQAEILANQMGDFVEDLGEVASGFLLNQNRCRPSSEYRESERDRPD